MMSHSSFLHPHKAQGRNNILRRFAPANVLFLVFLTAIFMGLASPAWAADKAPDWMREAARQTLPAYPPETVAVVLLDECVTTVKDKGEIETLYRRRDLAFLHRQRYVVQRLDRPVARGHVPQVEERAHYEASSSSPPR